MTKVQKTLQYLRNHPEGGSGLDIDSYVPQKRTAARIQDLEDLGYIIDSKDFVQGNTRTAWYKLVSSPGKTIAETPLKPIRWEAYTNNDGYDVMRPVYK